MSTLILKVRAEVLRANLDKIKNHLEDVPDRRTNLNGLLDCLERMGESFKNARKAILHARIDLEPEPGSPAAKQFGEAEQEVNNLSDNLKQAKELIHSMQKECFRIQDDQIGRDIARDLDRRTSPWIQSLAEVEANLQNPVANLQQQWTNFVSAAADASQSIFTEYIDFLGGLALRDAGFDTGISRIAQELVRTYSANRKNPDPMLAIPTRQQAVLLTLARIIRITFPDWTIWALPSTAHEFWHVVGQRDAYLERKLRSTLRSLTGNDADTIEPRFNNCLGDAFATYTMGPAYAYFAICLLLNPWSPFTCENTTVAEDVRVYSICQMLERMDSKETEMDPPYAKVRRELSEAWEDAIFQTGVQPKDAEAEQVAQDKRRAAKLVEALWMTLPDSSSPPFTVEVWNEVQEWVEPLLQNKVNEIKIPHGAELRHVLNAAWMARVHPRRSPKLDITAAANELANKIAELDGK